MPDYVGNAVMLMATKLANRSNFGRYTFKDDLIGNGVLSCVRYLKSFNPDKSTNAFAYVTQILHNAYVRQIQVEQTHAYTRLKLMQDIDSKGASRRKPSHLQAQNDELISRFENGKKKKSERQADWNASKSKTLNK